MSKEMTLRQRFKGRGFGVNSYADAKGLDQSTLSRVLSGEFDGKRNRKGSMVRKCIAALKDDGVWTDKLAWDNEKESV